ncbi:HNH/ENDO VII family nuclease [Streptococcus suis]|uniref:HNH/ENDO VII family nuclease n=1 Tax=Streptococcus suis TaxID=1307 RepID=UPI000410FFD8|nr:GH-E family nuclease [Streptococcus suis]
MGAGAGIATSATQNIRNQAVRHVVKAGIEAGVETAVDTGISVATGSPVTLKNVVTDYGLNLVTNGSGSISNTSATKPIKVGGVEVYDANYKHTRPIKDVTPVNNQKLLTGSDPNALKLEAPAITMRKLTPEESYLYRRPTNYRKNMKSDTWENASVGGVVTDPVTGVKMNPNEPWQMGHKPGYEFRKHQVSAANREISRKQFLDEYNNPQHFRPELPSSNMSHAGEDQTNTYFGPQEEIYNEIRY